MERVPARLDGTGWEVRALQMEWWPVLGWRLEHLGWWLEHLGWWLEHLEWMPTRLPDTRWKLRALPMGKVRQAGELAKDEARQIAANIA